MEARMYMCYMDNGENRIYCNPHSGRAESEAVCVNFKDGVKICENTYGSRCLEYKNVVYTDYEIWSNKKNEVFVRAYYPSDVQGRPTGDLMFIGKLKE